MCPYCFGRLASADNNLLKWCNDNKHLGDKLLQEWTGLCDDGKIYKVDNVTASSHKRLLWKCAKGHEWYSTVVTRTRSKLVCPKCTKGNSDDNLMIWCKGNEDFGKLLIEEWTGICEDGALFNIEEVSKTTNKRFLWNCAKNHTWYTSVATRVTHKSTCPYCSGRLASLTNNLKIWCNENQEFGQLLLSEWTGKSIDNKTYDIETVTKSSGKKFKWHCSKGHYWYSTVKDRTSRKTNCPYCSIVGTSYPEQFIYRALLQIYPNTISRGKYQGVEYDISIPEEKTCIEYSGVNWHADKLERDEMKAKLCESHGVKFIQIYAHKGEIDNKDTFDNDLIIYKFSLNSDTHNQQLVEILDHILKQFGHSISEIDIEKAQTEAFNFMHNIESGDK